MNMINTTFFTPECRFCRLNGPQEGMGCFRVVVQLPNDQMTFEDTWLHPHELHCPFDPEWRNEQVEIVWKKIGRAQMPDEVMVIERCTKQRAEEEKARYGEDEELTA